VIWSWRQLKSGHYFELKKRFPVFFTVLTSDNELNYRIKLRLFKFRLSEIFELNAYLYLFYFIFILFILFLFYLFWTYLFKQIYSSFLFKPKYVYKVKYIIQFRTWYNSEWNKISKIKIILISLCDGKNYLFINLCKNCVESSFLLENSSRILNFWVLNLFVKYDTNIPCYVQSCIYCGIFLNTSRKKFNYTNNFFFTFMLI